MLIEGKAITKIYPSTGKTAVDHADLRIDAGETVGLFGESGSGKSTLGMILAGLLSPTSGSLSFHGQPLRMPYRGKTRRSIQVLFQHPEISFNPVLPLMVSMKEPYRICRLPYAKDNMLRYLAGYGLRGEHLLRLPAELSGGELQRAALARILLMKPELVILDEPTSMLDVITQAQIMDMLRAYQAENHTAYLFITHNEALCRQFCHRIYPIHQGRFSL